MFLSTNELFNLGHGRTVTVNRKHAYIDDNVYGLAYERALDYLTATFSGGYHSPSTGKTHYGNYLKWTVCGTPTPVFHVKGKEVTCRKCKRIFKHAFPLNVRFSPSHTNAVPIIATTKDRVKYSQRVFFERVSRHAYRVNNGKWKVSSVNDGRPELPYQGESLRLMLSQPAKTRESSPVLTYLFPNMAKDVGVTCASFDIEAEVNGRTLIVPSSLCFVIIKTSSRYISMPLDRRAMRHIKIISGKFNVKAVEQLLEEWETYKSGQESMRKVLRGELKPIQGHELTDV